MIEVIAFVISVAFVVSAVIASLASVALSWCEAKDRRDTHRNSPPKPPKVKGKL